MKAAACFLICLAIVAPSSHAQKQTKSDSISAKSIPPDIEIRIAPEIAAKMLVHKAEPVCPRVAMPARVTGTVVVAIEIGKSGDVAFSKVISGPAMLKKPILNAV